MKDENIIKNWNEKWEKRQIQIKWKVWKAKWKREKSEIGISKENWSEVKYHLNVINRRWEKN